MEFQKIRAIILIAFLTTSAVAVSFTSEETTDTFTRPDPDSDIWAELLPGEGVSLEVRTESGWLGFDPGVAQAANTCSFRYRWLPPGTATVSVEGLPVVWAPSLYVSYAMTQVETPVYAGQDTTSTPLAVIPANSAVAIVGISVIWFRVDMNDSPEEVDIQGWILSEAISIN
ncbi:MAG: hypothetical protein KAH31_06705 [Candidatus Sabulitectum sp.]|nr:hypothetical protein [Candidatus Sabulitectum sp.]